MKTYNRRQCTEYAQDHLNSGCIVRGESNRKAQHFTGSVWFNRGTGEELVAAASGKTATEAWTRLMARLREIANGQRADFDRP